jgi:hypothetical protein
MISTVTTTTVTTIVTIASGASLGVFATILLISLLGVKEVASPDNRPWLKAFSKRLNVCILPLLLVFTLIVFFKTVQVLA